MVNKSFVVIILTILILGTAFYFLTNCSKEGFQENQEQSIPRYYSDIDGDGENDFVSSGITTIKQVDVEDGRLKMFKLDGREGFLYLTRVQDPKANISMKLELDPNKYSAQTLIETNNYTLEYQPEIIKFRYGSNRNKRKDFVIPDIEEYSDLHNLILNFNRRGGTVTISFGPEGRMTTYTSDDNVTRNFENERNYIMVGKSANNTQYFKGYIGDLKISSRREFTVQEPTEQVTTQAPTEATTQAPTEQVNNSPELAPTQAPTPVLQTVAVQQEEEFNFRRGNKFSVTNRFLEKRTVRSEIVPFPGLNKNIKMFTFDENSGFDIDRIIYKNLTLIFVIKFDELDYGSTIIEADGFSVKVVNGNLALIGNNERKLFSIDTKKMYFFILVVDNENSSVTLKLDMFQESIEYNSNKNIDKIKIGISSDTDDYFLGKIGYFEIRGIVVPIKTICNYTKLCDIVEENCEGYEGEYKCNNSRNKDGVQCEYNVVCVPKMSGSSIKRDKCAEYSTEVTCNNDRDCMVDMDFSKCREKPPVDIFEDVETPTYMAVPTTTTTRDAGLPPPKTCSFNAAGKTREACVDRCSNEFRSNQINEDCNPAVCRIICDKCTSPNCFWKSEESINEVREPMVPVPPKIKAYSGDSNVKLLWVAPYSLSEIEKYTCVIEGGDLGKETRIEFPVDTKCSLCEHIVGNLTNGLTYNLFVIATNKEGDSLPSNVVSLMPVKGKKLPDTGRKQDMEMNQLDDSLQEYKRAIEKGDFTELKNLTQIEDSDADYYELLDLLVSSKQNNRNLSEKMKIEIVN